MTSDQRLTLILGAIGILGIPSLAFMIRATVKWTRVEDKLAELVKDLDQLVRNNDDTHAAMLQTMADDRRATNTRLRWLEENIWKRGTRTQ